MGRVPRKAGAFGADPASTIETVGRGPRKAGAFGADPASTWMAIAILVVAAPAFAQGEAIVQGQLRTSADGAALPGATITLDAGTRGQPLQVITDGDGRFVFARVQPGDYVVSAALAGFDRRSVRVAIEPREVRTIALSLDVGRVNVSVDVTAEASTLTSTHSPSSTMLGLRDRPGQRVFAGAVFDSASGLDYRASRFLVGSLASS